VKHFTFNCLALNLYFIRHLPTEWNNKGILQGHNDISITSISEENNFLIKNNLLEIESIEFDIVLISKFIRTEETALAYNITEFQSEILLNELNFGKFEGKPKELMLKEISDKWFNMVCEITLG